MMFSFEKKFRVRDRFVSPFVQQSGIEFRSLTLLERVEGFEFQS